MFYNYAENGNMEAMAQFDLNWRMEEVIALFFEQDLYGEWLKIPTGDPMIPNAKICDSLYSLQALVPFPWPIWSRFGSVKMISYLDPSCNGVMIVVKSHDVDKKEFFGHPLPD